MKTILAYTRVVKTAREKGGLPTEYSKAEERFVSSYKQFKPPQDHELVIIECGGFATEDWDTLDARYIQYYGHGWDCGAYQFAANALECDLLVCLNSWAYFHTADWLYPLVRARDHFGPGLYGVSASFERGAHIRTPAMAVDPSILRAYPHAVHDRQACCDFEAGPISLTNFALSRKVPTLLMTCGEAVPPHEWRAPRLQNIFRRGNQKDVLVWDRHTDIYAAASPSEQKQLAWYADRL